PTLALLTQDVLRYGDEGNFIVFAYVGLVLVLAQGGLYQMLARRGVSEISFMLSGAGLVAGGLGSPGVVSFLANPGPWAQVSHSQLLAAVLVAVAVAVIGFAFLTPSVQALISRRSDPERQGEILGVNQSANAMSRILGPVCGLALYKLMPSHALPYAFSV